METYDRETAARVWQRVHAGSNPTHLQDTMLLNMIASESADAATYLRLSRVSQGRDAAVFRRLFEEEQAHTSCLKGIYTLQTGEKAIVPSPTPEADKTSATLRRCYGREMRSLAEYENRSTDPEYGPVFARLAAQEREHCKIVLELLGRQRE